jgi:hypothetical protein
VKLNHQRGSITTPITFIFAAHGEQQYTYPSGRATDAARWVAAVRGWFSHGC